MRAARLLSAIGCLAAGCAQMTVETEIRTTVRPDARPSLREDRVVATAIEARWSQRGRELELELREHRQCRTVEHLPAVQEERIVRKPDAMIYWEYGLAAVALGVSALAFARPELFAAEATYDDAQMAYVRDPKTGYRVGGVFTAVGAGFLTAGIVDSVRARDRVRHSDAVAVREGPVRPCDPKDIPVGDRAVELVLGERVVAGVSDGDGKVRLTLPDSELSPGPDDSPRTLAASLRVGLAAGMPVVLVAPIAVTADVPHTGAVLSGPL